MAERTDRLNMRMPPDVIERLRRAAQKDRRTVTGAVEKAIDLYVEHVEAEQGERKAAA
jgi:predicted DNA-binding protein